MLRIRLARFGRRNLPFYKLFVAERRSRRDGKPIDVVGWYDPHPQADGNKHVGLNLDKIKYWISVGAQPSDRVTSILARIGLIPPPPVAPKLGPPKRAAAQRK